MGPRFIGSNAVQNVRLPLTNEFIHLLCVWFLIIRRIPSFSHSRLEYQSTTLSLNSTVGFSLTFAAVSLLRKSHIPHNVEVVAQITESEVLIGSKGSWRIPYCEPFRLYRLVSDHCDKRKSYFRNNRIFLMRSSYCFLSVLKLAIIMIQNSYCSQNRKNNGRPGFRANSTVDVKL